MGKGKVCDRRLTMTAEIRIKILRERRAERVDTINDLSEIATG